MNPALADCRAQNPNPSNRAIPDNRPASQTENWLGNLTNALGDNEKLVSDLHSQLESVLRSEPEQVPMCGGGQPGSSPEEYLVSHADRIRALERRLAATNGVLRSILNRCEL